MLYSTVWVILSSSVIVIRILLYPAVQKEYLKSISDLLERTMDQRNSVLEDSKKEIQLVDGIDDDVSAYTIAPIVANGDQLAPSSYFLKSVQWEKWSIKRRKRQLAS